MPVEADQEHEQHGREDEGLQDTKKTSDHSAPTTGHGLQFAVAKLGYGPEDGNGVLQLTYICLCIQC